MKLTENRVHTMILIILTTIPLYLAIEIIINHILYYIGSSQYQTVSYIYEKKSIIFEYFNAPLNDTITVVKRINGIHFHEKLKENSSLTVIYNSIYPESPMVPIIGDRPMISSLVLSLYWPIFFFVLIYRFAKNKNITPQ